MGTRAQLVFKPARPEDGRILSDLPSRRAGEERIQERNRELCFVVLVAFEGEEARLGSEAEMTVSFGSSQSPCHFPYSLLGLGDLREVGADSMEMAEFSLGT